MVCSVGKADGAAGAAACPLCCLARFYFAVSVCLCKDVTAKEDRTLSMKSATSADKSCTRALKTPVQDLPQAEIPDIFPARPRRQTDTPHYTYP